LITGFLTCEDYIGDHVLVLKFEYLSERCGAELADVRHLASLAKLHGWLAYRSKIATASA